MLGRVHGLVGTGLLLAVKLGLSLVSRRAIDLVEVGAEALLLRAAMSVDSIRGLVTSVGSGSNSIRLRVTSLLSSCGFRNLSKIIKKG